MHDFLMPLLVAAMLMTEGTALSQSDSARPKLDAEGRIDCAFLRAHQSFLDRAKDPSIDLLFLGDSITEGWFWGDHRQIWDQYFGGYDAANFGIGGDRTEHLLWRIENGELDRVRPKAVVLLIGTNNVEATAAQVVRGVTRIVERIEEKLPESHVVLMGIFPRGRSGDAQRAKIREINGALLKLGDRKQVRFLDIGDRLPPDVMPDLLHINYKGYQIWAEALAPVLEEIMTK
jgi:lysophospholipase L1-like esterase